MSHEQARLGQLNVPLTRGQHELAYNPSSRPPPSLSQEHPEESPEESEESDNQQ